MDLKMQWSRAVLPKIKADERVLEFVPQKFDLGTPNSAKQYLENKKHGSDFLLNEAVREQTKIDVIEEEKEIERIEDLAIEKLKNIQETAYKEAYSLGLEEGRSKAFEKYSSHIETNLEQLELLLGSIENMKQEVLAANESHFIKLLFYMSSRIAMKELKNDNNILTDVIRNAVSLSQDEENVTVQVSSAQLEFIEGVKKQMGREFEFLKKIKFEPNDSITPGGCIVSTNFGEVDARVEQKIEMLWNTLIELIPKVEDEMKAE